MKHEGQHHRKEEGIRAVSGTSSASSSPARRVDVAHEAGHADKPAEKKRDAGSTPAQRPASWKTSDGFSGSAELKDESSKGKSGVGSFLANFFHKLTREPGMAGGDDRQQAPEGAGQERGVRADDADARSAGDRHGGKGLDIPDNIRGERRDDIEKWYQGLDGRDQRYYQKYLDKTDPGDRSKALTLFQKVDDGRVSDRDDRDALRTRVLDEAMKMPNREARFINKIVLTDGAHKDDALRDNGYRGEARHEGQETAASYNSNNNTVVFSSEMLRHRKGVQQETVAHELSHPKEDFNLSTNAAGRDGKEIAYGVGIKEAYKSVNESRESRREARETLESLYEARGDSKAAARDKAHHALENPEEYYASVRSLYEGSDKERKALQRSNRSMTRFLDREKSGTLPTNDQFVANLGKYGKEFGLDDSRVKQLQKLDPTDAQERLMSFGGARRDYRDGVQYSHTGHDDKDGATATVVRDRGTDKPAEGDTSKKPDPSQPPTATVTKPTTDTKPPESHDGSGGTGAGGSSGSSGSSGGAGSSGSSGGTGASGSSGGTGSTGSSGGSGSGGTHNADGSPASNTGTTAVDPVPTRPVTGGYTPQPTYNEYPQQPSYAPTQPSPSFGDTFMSSFGEMGMAGMQLLGQGDLTSFLQGNLTLLGLMGDIQLNPDGSVPTDMMSRLQQVADQQGVKLPPDLTAQDVGKAVQAAVQPSQTPKEPPRAVSGPVDFTEQVNVPSGGDRSNEAARTTPPPPPLGPPMPKQQMMEAVSGAYQNLSTIGARPEDLRTLAQASQTKEGAVYVSDALETLVTGPDGGAKMTRLLDKASQTPDGARSFAQTLSSMAEANPARAVGLMLLTTDAGAAPQMASLFHKMGDDPTAATSFASFFEHATRTPDGARGMGELLDTLTAPAADGDRTGTKQVASAFKEATGWVQGSRDVTQGFVNTLETEGGSRAFARTMHRLTSTVDSSAATGQTLKNMSFDRQGTEAVSQLVTRATVSRDGARQMLEAFNRIADTGEKGRQDVSLLLNRVSDTNSGGRFFSNVVSDKHNAEAFNTLLSKLEQSDVCRDITTGTLEKVATRAALPDATKFQKAVSGNEALSHTLDRFSWRNPLGGGSTAGSSSAEPLRLQPSGYAAMQTTPGARAGRDAGVTATGAVEKGVAAPASARGGDAPHARGGVDAAQTPSARPAGAHGPTSRGVEPTVAPPASAAGRGVTAPPAGRVFVDSTHAAVPGRQSAAGAAGSAGSAAPVSSSLFSAPPTAKLSDYAPVSTPAAGALSAPPTAKLDEAGPVSRSAASYQAPPTAKLDEGASVSRNAGSYQAPPTAKLDEGGPAAAPAARLGPPPAPTLFQAPPTAKLTDYVPPSLRGTDAPVAGSVPVQRGSGAAALQGSGGAVAQASGASVSQGDGASAPPASGRTVAQASGASVSQGDGASAPAGGGRTVAPSSGTPAAQGTVAPSSGPGSSTPTAGASGVAAVARPSGGSEETTAVTAAGTGGTLTRPAGPVRLSGPARPRSTDPAGRDADAPRADLPGGAASVGAVAPTNSTHATRPLDGSAPPSQTAREHEPHRLFSFRPGDVYSEDTLLEARICPDCGFRLTSAGTCVRCNEYERRELVAKKVEMARQAQI